MDKSEKTIDIEKFEKIIDYSFQDKQLIYQAFSHTSYINERKKQKLSSYERLEFLGDSVVNTIVSRYLFVNYPGLSEGELTRIRSIAVCESTLHKCSKNLGFGEFVLLGKGEELTGGRERVSILADLFESVAGAIFLEGAYQNARVFIINQLMNTIIDAVDGTTLMDYKTQLQETLQKHNESNIVYESVKETGPDHDKEFLIEVKNNNIVLGQGIGKSKKEAEQRAAKEALKFLTKKLLEKPIGD